MLIVMSSPGAVAPNGIPKTDIIQLLIELNSSGTPVGIISNHSKPVWFDECFKGSCVQFLSVKGRQSGEIVKHNASLSSMEPHDVLVLAANSADVQMGKNGGAVLVAAGWSSDSQVQGLGIRVDSSAEFKQVFDLIFKWPGHWWLSGDEPHYRVRALADLSSYYKSITQQGFSDKVKDTVKNGGVHLNALLAITARSLLVDGIGNESKLLWGVYPSSASKNDDSETLSDFGHRLRTTVSRVHLVKRGEPLFIRHKPSPKRSAGGVADRTNTANQIETIQLNPCYSDGQLKGRHVIVLDDCTTYGVSFGVAAAFLRRAGAAMVTGVALGKFGNQLHYYEVDIKSNPFAPVSPAEYEVTCARSFNGTTSGGVQSTLISLIP